MGHPAPAGQGRYRPGGLHPLSRTPDQDPSSRVSAVLLVTCLLLALALLLIIKDHLDGLAGAIVGGVTGYWLPTRPNRREPS